MSTHYSLDMMLFCFWILSLTYFASSAKNDDAKNASMMPSNSTFANTTYKKQAARKDLMLQETLNIKNINNSQFRDKEIHSTHSDIFIDPFKLPLNPKNKSYQTKEKFNVTAEKKNRTKCYKPFFWCQRHSKTTIRKTECHKELKQCLVTACKKANKCNPAFEMCLQKSAKKAEKVYKCYKEWKNCAESFCSN